MSDTLTAQYQHAQAHAALDQAELALQFSAGRDDLMETQEWLQVQLARIQIFYWNNFPEQMEVILRKIGPTVEAVGRVDQKIALLTLEIQARMRRERYVLSEETLKISRRRLTLAETLNDPYDLAVAQFQHGFTLLWYGDLEAARDWLTQGCTATDRVGARLWYLRSLTYLGIVSRKLNDLPAARQQTRDVLELAPLMNEHTYHGIGLANQGWLAWRDGDAARAEQLCQEANRVWGYFGGDVFHGLTYWVLLAAACSRRDLRQAEDCARALLDPDPLYRPVEESLAGLLQQAVYACQAQDSAAAFALFAHALENASGARDL